LIRYLVSFPVSSQITPRDVEYISEQLRRATDTRSWRDIVLGHGGTITDMRRNRRSKVWVKNAQRRLR
jgi:hypothetical protein